MSVVHLVLDEAAALGPMPAVDDLLALGRGYGLRVHLFYQNAAQLMRCYPDGQHQFVLGVTTNVFFAAHDWVTCEEISKRSGSRTVVVDSGGVGDGTSRQSAEGVGPATVGTSHNANANWAFAPQPLIRPEQVAALPTRVAISFVPGVPAPVATWLDHYYEAAATPTFCARVARRIGSSLWAASVAVAGVALSVLAATADFSPPARTGPRPGPSAAPPAAVSTGGSHGPQPPVGGDPQGRPRPRRPGVREERPARGQ